MTEAHRDWLAWHEPYADPDSHLSRRLATVRRHLRSAFDDCDDGRISVISMCAGQGHDLSGVLEDHPRRTDVDATLVELDVRNVEAARKRFAVLGVAGVDVIEADAGTSAPYEDRVPADVVLACGVFGNVDDDGIRDTIRLLPSLCARKATVIWTRHRFPPDATPWIREAFDAAGFDEVAFDAPADTHYGVGVHRFAGNPQPYDPEARLFTFTGFDALAGS